MSLEIMDYILMKLRPRVHREMQRAINANRIGHFREALVRIFEPDFARYEELWREHHLLHSYLGCSQVDLLCVNPGFEIEVKRLSFKCERCWRHFD